MNVIINGFVGLYLYHSLCQHGELKNKNSYIKFESKLQDDSVCMSVSGKCDLCQTIVCNSS